MIQKLTKELFWNPLHEKYPEEVQRFYDWIDDYKKQTSWDNLFNAAKAADREYFDWNGEAVEIKAPKFHDLPDAMQFGIFLQFSGEPYREIIKPHISDFEERPYIITDYFYKQRLTAISKRLFAEYRNDIFPDNTDKS